MKHIRKMIAALGLVTMLGSNAVAQVPEKVEIKFSVGQNVLLINGVETQVETPYVVGEGVTLVPLRVITEAFGAEVEWVAETKTVNLSYPDVEISLQIDNPVAEVNLNAEELLAPPELTANGFTMVPLRFISETFGAEVSYDDATKAITVVKQTTQSSDQTVVDAAITESRVGDSFYGWTMDNPANFTMTYKNFDNTVIDFSADENNEFNISIYEKDEDFNFEREFIEWKNSFSGLTLIKADKNTETIVKSMHFQAKNKEMFTNVLVFETDKYIMVLDGVIDVDKTELKEEMISVMNSFKAKFESEDTHDLSIVRGSVRPFEDEDVKFSIEVPVKFFLLNEDGHNEIEFVSSEKNDVSEINVGIYSKSDTGTAKELAEKDRRYNVWKANEKLLKFTDVKEVSYKNFNGYEYTYKISGSTKSDSYTKDVFFELGDYVYNVTVTMLPSTTAEKEVNKILDSIKAEPLDIEEVGILMRNSVDYEGSYEAKSDKWSIKLPNSYIVAMKSDTKLQAVCNNTGVIFDMTLVDSNDSLLDIKEDLKAIEEEINKTGSVNIVAGTSQVKIGSLQYVKLVARYKDDGSYIRTYGVPRGGYVVEFTVMIPELVYSQDTINQVEEIISSLKLIF